MTDKYIPSNITMSDLANAFNRWRQEVVDNDVDFEDIKTYGDEYGVYAAKKLMELIRGDKDVV